MNLNILDLFGKIIIDDTSFDKIKAYARSKNIRVPDNTNLDGKLFNNLNDFKNSNLENLDDPYLGEPKINETQTQERFKKLEDEIFINSTRMPSIYTDFIYKYHIYSDASLKEKAINTLKDCLVSINNVYDYLKQDKKYFDNDLNIIFNNLNMGLVRRIESRIQEVYSLEPASLYNSQQIQILDILKQYDLI
jgi:hypothetical protein